MKLRFYQRPRETGRPSLVLLLALFLLLVMLSFALREDLARGFRLPSMSEEHEDLKDWVEQVRASDVQSSRSRRDPPARKASEDVHPMNTDNLMDMEETVYPSFGQNPYAWWDYDAPDWWYNPAGEYGTRPYTFPWDADPGSGSAWRVCRPEAGGYYIECGTCENWPINQPDSDILELTTFTGQGNWTHFDNDLITVCAYAGAETGQEITVGYSQIPVGGGVVYPETYCEKTYHVQCGEECECQGATPPIYASSTTITRGASVDLWVGSSLACGPFTWSVSGTGFHFGSTSGPTTGETEEELEIIALYADGSACGTATITVTDSCGVTDTGYIRCTSSGSWCSCRGAGIGGCNATGSWGTVASWSPVSRLYVQYRSSGSYMTDLWAGGVCDESECDDLPGPDSCGGNGTMCWPGNLAIDDCWGKYCAVYMQVYLCGCS